MSSTPEEKVELLREHVRESGDVADEDADLLLEFSDLLEDTRIRRHENLLRHCTIMAEEVDDGLLAASLSDREAAEAIMDWLFETGFNEKENRNFRVALRVFGKKLSGSDEPPESIGWIPTHTSADYDPSPGHHI